MRDLVTVVPSVQPLVGVFGVRTSVQLCDALWGSVKRRLLVWHAQLSASSARRVLVPGGKAYTLARELQIPMSVVEDIHAAFRMITLDTKGIAAAPLSVMWELIQRPERIGCVPYWAVFLHLNLPITPLYSIIFDRLLCTCVVLVTGMTVSC